MIFAFVVSGCSNGLLGGNQQKNMEQLDKIWGKCNNPHRILSKAEKLVCEDKERAAGPDGVVGEPVNVNEVLNRIRGGGEKIVYAGAAINPFLWNSSLAVVDKYSLRTVDSQGGFISTDWIINEKFPNQRCLIKINVTSKDLVSNGINTKFICENKKDSQWFIDEKEYLNEEKNLTIKILQIASELSKTDNQS